MATNEDLAWFATVPNRTRADMAALPGSVSEGALSARCGCSSSSSPQAEHWLDWFHITMRLTVLTQMAKGLRSRESPRLIHDLMEELERLKWYLRHGNVFLALQTVTFAQLDIDSNPRASSSGLKPAATSRIEERRSDCAITAAVVVPSPTLVYLPDQMADEHATHVFEWIRELECAPSNRSAAIEHLRSKSPTCITLDRDGARKRSKRRPQQSSHAVDTAQHRRVRGRTRRYANAGFGFQ